jgi:putative tricarboxylic transport membrane protein
MSDSAPDNTGDSSLVSTRTVGVGFAAILLSIGLLLAWDNYRLGVAWGRNGPGAGSFPFGLSIALAIASAVALVAALRSAPGEVFVTRWQLRRVLTVFIPILLFAGVTQVLGIYVASAALIAGFMRFVGKSRSWVSLAVGLGVTFAMFIIFEIEFQVPLPKGPIEDWLGF